MLLLPCGPSNACVSAGGWWTELNPRQALVLLRSPVHREGVAPRHRRVGQWDKGGQLLCRAVRYKESLKLPLKTDFSSIKSIERIIQSSYVWKQLVGINEQLGRDWPATLVWCVSNNRAHTQNVTAPSFQLLTYFLNHQYANKQAHYAQISNCILKTEHGNRCSWCRAQQHALLSAQDQDQDEAQGMGGEAQGMGGGLGSPAAAHPVCALRVSANIFQKAEPFTEHAGFLSYSRVERTSNGSLAVSVCFWNSGSLTLKRNMSPSTKLKIILYILPTKNSNTVSATITTSANGYFSMLPWLCQATCLPSVCSTRMLLAKACERPAKVYTPATRNGIYNNRTFTMIKIPETIWF